MIFGKKPAPAAPIIVVPQSVVQQPQVVNSPEYRVEQVATQTGLVIVKGTENITLEELLVDIANLLTEMNKSIRG